MADFFYAVLFSFFRYTGLSFGIQHCDNCRINYDIVVFISKPEALLPVFQTKKPEVRPPKKAFSFQVHYGHSKGNTPDGEIPKAGSRTLKTEYHSLGQNNETSVIRGPAIKKAGWLKSQ